LPSNNSWRAFLIIDIENLGKTYVTPSGDKKALSGFCAVIPSHGITSIVGSSGSGKSTLLNLLALLETPTEGMVLFRGKNITQLKNEAKENYRNFECGFVFQHFQLFDDLSAEENVSLPLQLRGEEEKAVKERTDHLFAYFHLKGIQQRKTRLLSGGEKQRVAILRALIGEPSIVFADEPTGALDEKNASLVMDFLKEIAKTRAVILVSHNPALVSQYADRVLTLEEGRLVSNADKNERNRLRSSR
jgi:ABC-type lipoprotein export system ATPase subunit